MAFGDFCSRNYPLPLLHCGSKIIASFHHSITTYRTTSYLIELLQLQLEVVLRCGHSRPPAAAAAATAQAPPGQPASPTFVVGNLSFISRTVVVGRGACVSWLFSAPIMFRGGWV